MAFPRVTNEEQQKLEASKKFAEVQMLNPALDEEEQKAWKSQYSKVTKEIVANQQNVFQHLLDMYEDQLKQQGN